MKFLKKTLPFLLILFCSLWAIKPLLATGFFPMHDDTQVARVFEMHKSLVDGEFPVRWVSDLGYGFGYPIFNFYAPFAYYIGAFVMFLGANALFATKIMMIFGIVTAGVSMFLFAKQFWGIKGGIISALLYVYASYHGLDVYVRGDVAEFFAYAVIPFVFYGFYKIFQDIELRKEENHKTHLGFFLHILFGSLGLAIVVVSHNLTAYMLVPFFLLFLVFLIYVSKRKGAVSLHFLIMSILGVALSAFYAIPAVFESRYTNVLSQIGGGADFRDHFVCIQQLWSSPWGYGGSAAGCVDGLSFMIGKICIILGVAGIIIAFVFWKKLTKDQKTISVFSSTGLILSVFLLLEISKPIWQITPFMAFLQYPWRYLLFVSFFISFIAGASVLFIHHVVKNKYVSAGILLVVIVIIVSLQGKFFSAQTQLSVNSEYYTNPHSLLLTASKISDEYLPKNFQKPSSFTQTARQTFSSSDTVLIKSQTSKTQVKRAVIQVKRSGNLDANLTYFPSWKAFVDSREVSITAKQGRVSFIVPPGEHNVLLAFKQTPIELISNAISLTGIVSLLIGIIVLITKKYA